MGADRYISQ